MADKHFYSIRGRIGACFLDFLEAFMDRKYGAKKRSVFGEFPEQVVEIGPGPGANLRYYRPGTRLVAIEPNPAMHDNLRKNARRYGIAIDVRGIKGEAMDLPNNSVEVVVGTLVLCSVDQPRQVVEEVLRVLRPGGRFVFLEHVAAPDGTILNRLQGLLHRPWHWFFEGCHLNRNTHSLLLNSGFSSVDMDCFMLNSLFYPITPHIFGRAVK